MDRMLDKCNTNRSTKLNSQRRTVLLSRWGDALDSESNQLDGGEEMQLADRVPVYGCGSASDDDIDALIAAMLSLTSRLEGRK